MPVRLFAGAKDGHIMHRLSLLEQHRRRKPIASRPVRKCFLPTKKKGKEKKKKKKQSIPGRYMYL